MLGTSFGSVHKPYGTYLQVTKHALFMYQNSSIVQIPLAGGSEAPGKGVTCRRWDDMTCLFAYVSMFYLPPTPTPLISEARATWPAAHAQDMNRDLRAKSLNPGCKTIKPKLSTF